MRARPALHPCVAPRRKALRLLAAALASAFIPLRPAAAQHGEKRIALVIGNSAYKAGALKNPVNDAVAVADRLKQLGFEVVSRQNTNLRDLVETLRDFSLRAASYAVRVVFYAGHGVQAKGRNYLLPVDADVQTEDDIPGKSADIGALIDRLGSIKHGINIVILDACRVNPFAGGVIALPDGRRLKFRGSTPTGLAQLDAPIGTLVAFSTAPGGVALDGTGARNSIYTKHLLANLDKPGLAIEQLFKKVRIGVAEETQRVQVPWESSSLTAEFCFKVGATGSCGA